MRMKRLSGVGKRMLSPVIFCCLWAFAVPADAQAPAPAFGNASCYVQSVTMGGMTVWQIKGTVSVNNLLPKSSVNVTFTFQKLPNGAKQWGNMFTAQQTAPSNNGTAMLDTGFQNFNPAPAAGDAYRISVNGTWATQGPPPMNGNLQGIASAIPIIPVK